MPIYEIHTLERWEADAYYRVEADTKEEAREMVMKGDVPYYKHEHGTGHDEVIAFLSVREE